MKGTAQLGLKAEAVMGWIMSFKILYIKILTTPPPPQDLTMWQECDKVFTEVIKLKLNQVEIRVNRTSSNMTGILMKRGTWRETHVRGESSLHEEEGRRWSEISTSQGTWTIDSKPASKVRSLEQILLHSPRRIQLCWHLDLALLSRTASNRFLLFKARSSWCLVLAVLAN